MSLGQKIRELRSIISEKHWIYHKEIGKVFLVKHISPKYTVGLMIVPLSNGFSVRSTDGKYKAGLKTQEVLSAEIDLRFPVE